MDFISLRSYSFYYCIRCYLCACLLNLVYLSHLFCNIARLQIRFLVMKGDQRQLKLKIVLNNTLLV